MKLNPDSVSSEEPEPTLGSENSSNEMQVKLTRGQYFDFFKKQKGPFN